MKHLKCSIATVLLGATLCLSAWGAAAQDSLPERLQTVLDGWQTEYNITGVTMAIAGPEFDMIELAAGLNNVAEGVEMTPDRPILISSLTKTYVATMVLQLVDEGELSLDDTLSQWFPDFPNANLITIRQLLGHTGGATEYETTEFRTHLAEVSLERHANNGPGFAPQELIDASSGLESSFPPGTSFGYSNTNYVLLGRIIEEVTGDSLHVNLRSRLFSPQGLQNSYLAGAEPVPQDWGPGYATVFAELFGVTDGVFVLDEQMSTLIASTAWAAGAIVATAGDVVQFQQALAHDEYLRPATLAQMNALSPVTDSFLDELGFTGYGAGLGIFMYPFTDPIGPGFGYSGGEPGYSSLMMTFSDHDISVAILVNDGSADFAVIPRGRDYDALLANLVLEALGD